MVDGWPDAIHCVQAGGRYTLYNDYTYPNGLALYRYIQNPTATDVNVLFNSDKSFFSSTGITTSDCESKTIAQLYSE